MKNLLLSVAALLCSQMTLGQLTEVDGGLGSGSGSGSSSSQLSLPNVVPPAPEAAGLSKFIEVPVSHYTGLPNVSVPIYTVQEKGVQIPISLSYHARGVKVAEVASSVGTGWSLNYGGIVSRQIRGKADDSAAGNTYLKNKAHFAGYAHSQNIRAQQSFAEELDAGYDFYPDQFTFNAGSVSGKFVLDYNTGKPVIQSFGDVKVETVYENSKIVGFRIVDTAGNTYYFGKSKDGLRTGNDYEYASGKSIYFNRTVDDPPSASEINYSSWKLMDITTVYGETVSFYYEKDSFNRYRKAYDAHTTTGVTNGAAGMTNIDGIYSRFSAVASHEYRLTEIRHSQGKVVFKRSAQAREDYNGYALDAIEIHRIKDPNNVNDNTLVKTYKLTHYYTTSNTTSNILPYFTNHSMFGKAYKRMFLSKVEEYNRIGQKLPGYEFTYNPQVLPSRYSTSQDYWGYFNGANNGPFLRMFEYGIYKSNRRVDPEKSEAGLLKEIKQPTGGKTLLTYEDNIGLPPEYLRNKDVVIPAVNPLSQDQIKRSYTKKDFSYSAALGYAPLTVNDLPLHTKVYYRIFCKNFQQPGVTNIPDCMFNFTVNGATVAVGSEQFFNTLASRTATLTVHPKIVSGLDPNLHRNDAYDFQIELWYEYSVPTAMYAGGKRIKRITKVDGATKIHREFSYEFGANATSGVINALPSFINAEPSPFGVTRFGSHTLTYYYCSNSSYGMFNSNAIGYARVTEYQGTKADNLGKTEYDFTVTPDGGELCYEFPYHPPTDNEWLRGKNIETRVYQRKTDNSYNLVKRVYNKYAYSDQTYIRDYNLPGFKTVDTNPFVHHPREKLYRWEQNDATVQKVHSSTLYKLPLFMRRARTSAADTDPNFTYGYRIYYLTGGTLHLKYTTEYNYFGEVPDLGSTNYLANTSNYFYDYAKNYQVKRTEVTNSKGNVLKTEMTYPEKSSPLGEQNRIIPIKTVSYQDGQKLSEQETIFTTSGIILPKIIKASKGTQTTENRIEYHHYDNKGNPTEVSKTNGTHVVYIWGYQQKFPVAKIENARLSAIPANYITAIQQASDADFDRTMDTRNAQGVVTAFNGKEGLLRQSFQNLRNLPALQKATMTFYTYDPSVGVTSISDNRGQTVYYDYDAFNRLKFVKDMHGNILKENSYHYKNN